MKQYHQCRLQRGYHLTVGWIEARAAKVGAQVEMLPSGEFWEVVEVFEYCMSEDMLKKTKALNRHSLPSIEPVK